MSRPLVSRVAKATLVAALLALGAAAAFAARGPWLTNIPSYTTVRANYKPSDLWIVDRGGVPFEKIRVEKNGRRFAWLALKEVPPLLQDLVLQSEDRRFYDHAGVDLWALAASAWRFVSHLGSAAGRRGGSTLTMQLAAMLTEDPELKAGHRSLAGKWRQMILAWRLEKSWSKAEILESYFNLTDFRGELQGLNAASHLLFYKNASGLQEGEMALLVALLRSPNAPWEQVKKRACAVAPKSCPALSDLIPGAASRAQAVNFDSVRLAPHFAHRVARGYEKEKASSWLESTLDIDLQKQALQLASEQMSLLARQNVHDVAALVVENRTGEVLAYLGNVGRFSSAQDIDGVQIKRQAGSTLKPFLYAAAFEARLLAPNSLLSDVPFELDTGRGLYRPQNYDHRFRGTVSVRSALASSMNIPAVRALQLVTPDVFVEWLRKLGFADLTAGEDYGVSLALGTADVSLWELVRAYRVFANHGSFADLRETPSRGEVPVQRIFSDETVFRIGDILSDREARSATFGLENPLATRFWTAVKTGTSKDMRDNWCIGFSSEYTVGVWVGNFNGDAMWDVSGISGAAPIWVGLMNALQSRAPSRAPSRPDSLANDSRPAEPLGKRAFKKILSPVAGTVTVWDPDIPAERQKLLFEASGTDEESKWQLDGATICRADRPCLWRPKPGRHHLKLLGANGVAEDEVQFTVRR